MYRGKNINNGCVPSPNYRSGSVPCMSVFLEVYHQYLLRSIVVF